MLSDRARKHLSALFVRYPALSSCRQEIIKAAGMLADAYRSGGKILLCGNGGSACDCAHIAGELMKGFLLRRPLSPGLASAIDRQDPSGTAFSHRLQAGLPAIDLTAQSGILTASINDIAGELVFAQQVLGYGKPGDVLVGISTSGNSANVVKAFAVARALDMRTLALTGSAGGILADLADCAIRVPAIPTPDVQELHLPVYHALCAAVEAQFFKE